MIPGVEIPTTACPGHSPCSANGTAGTLVSLASWSGPPVLCRVALRPRQGWLQGSRGPTPCRPFLGYLVKSRGVFLCEQALRPGLPGSPGGQPPPGQAQRFTNRIMRCSLTFGKSPSFPQKRNEVHCFLCVCCLGVADPKHLLKAVWATAPPHSGCRPLTPHLVQHQLQWLRGVCGCAHPEARGGLATEGTQMRLLFAVGQWVCI